MSQTVFIIDDNENDVLIAKRVISKVSQEITVDVASNGEEGLASLRGGKTLPSLILLDLKMPGMDGVEVLRRIRSDERLKHIPVVVVTHSALESDVAASYREGANGVLHKAFDIDRFGREVKSLLDCWL